MSHPVKKVVCPHCGEKAWKYGIFHLKKKELWVPRYKCSACKKTFTYNFSQMLVCPTCQRPA